MRRYKIIWLCKIPIPNISIKNEHPVSWIVNLLNCLHKYHDLEITIVSYSTRIKHDIHFEKDNVKYIYLKTGLPFVNRGYPNMLPLDIIFNFKKLRKKVKNVLKKIEPDLVHVHGTETGFATVAQSIAYLKILSIQGVLTEVLKHENTFKFKLLAGLEKNIIKSFVNFACRTNYDKDFVIKYNQLANVIKLEEAVNPIYFQTNWVFNKNKTLLYIGGIIDRKGIYTLLDTLDELNKEGNNYFLKIIGGGSTQSIKKMNSIINNYNLRESVEYLGVLKPEQISLLFSQSNMYVCSSKIENSPNSVCEAMAVGIPVVAFNVGGLASLINNGEDGFLVTNYNTSELKSCILKVNSLSQSQLLKVSCAAKERAILRNQPDRVAENYYKEYLQLLGHSK